jgi:cell division septation protein DedD
MTPETSNSGTLNPKQLVFFFMAATVVSVVVFLCGVLVGRGVSLRSGSEIRNGDGVILSRHSDEVQASVLDSGSIEPPVASRPNDDLTYYRRLRNDAVIDETLPETPTFSGDISASSEDTVPALNSENDEESQTIQMDQISLEASGYAYTVQVAALRALEAAERIAGRLIAKGYPAYVLEPTSNAPVAMYRVRVGQYPNHGDAEQVRQQLEREEKFKPWITR